jgi:hypothetical protein
VQGESIGTVMSVYGFFSFEPGSLQAGIPRIIFWFGTAASVFIVMLGLFAVSLINIEAIRGNRFFSAREAFRFTLRRAGQIARAEIAIIVFVLFILFLFFLFGLVTRIPYLGEWIFTIFFVIPNFIIAIFTVFIVFIVVLSVLLLPAVAAAERRGEAFTVIVETFSTIVRLPLRWLSYTAYTVVTAKLSCFIYAYFAFRAVQLMTWASSIGAGDKVPQLVKAGLAHLSIIRSPLAYQVTNIFPGIRWGFDIPSGSYFRTETALSYVMAIMLFIVFVTVIGYALAILAAGQARIYVALKYIKDGYRISEEPSIIAKADKTSVMDTPEMGNPKA